MTPKKLDELSRIAAMIRDREMAELAHYATRRRRIEDEIAATKQGVRDAFLQGQEAVYLAAVAAQFDLWSKQKQSMLVAELETVQAEIDTQKEKTAKAVGRHRNLEQISDCMHEKERRAALRRAK